MKIDLQKLKTKEYIIKFSISIALLVFLFVSFFFSSSLEQALHLKVAKGKNEISYKQITADACKVSYIDVGQGNCTLIELPDGRVALIDGGDVMYGEVVYKFLTDRNISKIDILIATHADADHIGGLNYLFSRMDISKIYRPFQIAGTGETAETFEPIEAEDLKEVYDYYKTDSRNKISRVTSDVYHEFINNVYNTKFTENSARHIEVFYDELVIAGGNYTFEFYAPLKRDRLVDLSKMSSQTKGYATVGFGAGNSNDNSAIFTFSYNGETFLFTGDSAFKESDGETTSNCGESEFVNSLTAREKEELKDISVYLAGHHGSEYSSGEKLLSLINPRFVVISVAEYNDFGHPSMQTLDRIAATTNLEKDFLLCTDNVGTIVFTVLDGDLKYALLSTSQKEARGISYELFSSVIVGFVIVVVFSIKPLQKNVDSKKQ